MKEKWASCPPQPGPESLSIYLTIYPLSGGFLQCYMSDRMTPFVILGCWDYLVFFILFLVEHPVNK